MTDRSAFSDWVVYVDESGDHGLASIDETYPVFVLLFVLFRQNAYCNRFVPPLSQLKFRLFGHDGVVLHEREIRKNQGVFKVLGNRDRKEIFLEELNQIIERTPFEVVAAAHDKRQLVGAPSTIEDLYHQSLRFGLELIHDRLQREGVTGTTHIVCEARGGKEDRELAAAFRRTCDGDNAHKCQLDFELVVTNKSANSAGLQLADMIARPIGLSVLRPEQPNRAYDLIRTKLMRGPDDQEGWGLRCFP